MKKLLVVGVIVLFLGMSVIPSTGTIDVKQISMPTSSGNTLYVGGSGTGNYTRIQDAIDDASDGDTVFVYDDSSPYYENVLVDKPIQLIGEDRNSTVIDGSGIASVVCVSADGVKITGFSIQNSGKDWYTSGIEVRANFTEITNNLIYSNNFFGIDVKCYDNNTIIENIIFDNGEFGIRLWCSSDNKISNNTILSDNRIGIEIEGAHYNIISNNNISNHSRALDLYTSQHNTISNNTFNNNLRAVTLLYQSNKNLLLSNHINGPIVNSRFETGAHFVRSYENTISKNTITNYKFGIFLEGSYGTIIEMNTFLKNIVNARFIDSESTWSHNYWNRPRILPKPIFGIKRIDDIIPRFLEFDWHPATEPYDIEV